MAEPVKRVGLLGTSANPFHAGHEAMALQAKEKLGLDEVWVLVALCNPFKNPEAMAPFSLRIAMAEMRAQVYDWLKVCDFELEHHLAGGEDSRTYSVLHALRARYPDISFTWLMGSDNALNFHKWHGYEWIIQNHPIAIFSREERTEGFVYRSPALMHYFALRVLPEKMGVNASWCVMKQAHSASATRVRKQIKAGDIPVDISADQLKLIKRYNLYGA